MARFDARVLACIVATGAFFACAPTTSSLDWVIAFEEEALRSRAAVVEVALLEGTCDSPEAALRWMRLGVTGFPSLGAGRYAFFARARDAGCQVIAAGCREVRLPDDGASPVRVTVRGDGRGAGADLCPGGECRAGLCDAELDAGFDAGLGDASRTDAPSPFDAGLDAPSLDAGAIDVGTPPGFDAGPEACVGGCAGSDFRLLRPLSGSIVHSTQPTLHYAVSPALVATTRVEICRERSCATLVESQGVNVTGRTRPLSSLSPGTYFWRVRTGDFSLFSHTWELRVGAGPSSPLDTAHDTILDVNGDGLVDVAVTSANEVNPPGEGVLRVYHGAPGALGAPASTRTITDGALMRFGVGLAPAGDVNGDGFIDLLVGAPLASWSGSTSAGSVFVYHGGPSGLDAGAPTILRSPEPSIEGSFGWSVASAGDVNSDGYADIVVGAPNLAPGGAAFVYLGSSSGLSITHARRLSPVGVGDCGRSVLGAIDTDGDGYTEVAIGCPGLAPSGAGGVMLFESDGVALGASPRQTLYGLTVDFYAFGYTIALAGDADNDGTSDLAVGDPLYTGHGAVLSYYGGAAGLTLGAEGLEVAPTADGFFGIAMGAGDFDLDGRDDLVVGSPRYMTTAGYVGLVSVMMSQGRTYLGPFGTAPATYEALGTSLAAARSLDGVAPPQILVGAPNTNGRRGLAALMSVSGTSIAGGQVLLGADIMDGYFGNRVAR